MNDLDWDNVPLHILANIFAKLQPTERLNASLVCYHWSKCFHYSQLWRYFLFKLDNKKDPDGSCLTCIDKYANELRDVDIQINQIQKQSRERGCYILSKLQEMDSWKLRRLRFGFSGENPPCFNGGPILNALKDCLQLKERKVVFPLLHIDLSQLDVALDDELLNIFSNDHRSLQICHIQNSCFIDNTTPEGIVNLLKNCPKIEEFYSFYHCITDEVLKCLTEKDRASLKVLSLKCSRCDKYNARITSEAWKKLRNKHKDLQVSLAFDSTMPLPLVKKILVEDIPVTKINLKVYCWVHAELHHIARQYCDTLTCLIIHNSIDPYDLANDELITALMDIISVCTKLTELHCYVVLPPNVITDIKNKCDLKKFTLY